MHEGPGDRPAGAIVDHEGRHSPATFFVLVFALAVPFWVLGWATSLQLMPGLPIAGLMFVCPGLAALILAFREGGSARAGALAKRLFDFRRLGSIVWLAPILLLEPLAKTLAFFVLRWSGSRIPVPHIDALPTMMLCVIFFVSASGEELGWSGYATEPLQARWGVVGASLILGAVWAAFHYVALVEAHRSVSWIAWWTLVH
jgi:membrane protease YdiL (CAAX protease family)